MFAYTSIPFSQFDLGVSLLLASPSLFITTLQTPKEKVVLQRHTNITERMQEVGASPPSSASNDFSNQDTKLVLPSVAIFITRGKFVGLKPGWHRAGAK